MSLLDVDIECRKIRGYMSVVGVSLYYVFVYCIQETVVKKCLW